MSAQTLKLPWGKSLASSPGDDRPTSPARHAVARGLAGFLGLFTLIGLVGRQRWPGFDANLWWLDLRALPEPVALAATAMLGALLLAWAGRPRTTGTRQRLTQGVVAGALVVLAVNALNAAGLFLTGLVAVGFPLPASVLFGAGLIFILGQLGSPAAGSTDRSTLAVTSLSCFLLFPLVQVVCFGRTDYRRTADAAVVFGARVYADGRLSDAVGDRVRTAVELYRQGWVRELVMSGGPGDGAIHETAAMRAEAIRSGVPAAAIRCDLNGLSTAHTVRNTAGEFAGHRLLAVSEYYHLPRIKLAYARAGLDVFTVPAAARDWRRTWDLRSVLREVPAFWLYYGRAVLGRG
jgi:uncharacterized SAM-binding protein YcdF (DUF218 family)